MTTTPDSRIRADWTLPAETAAPPPTVAPDTSTTAGRIAVMQAWDRGEDIEVMVRAGGPWRKAYGGVSNIPNGSWNWVDFDYRIAPPERTALQSARERARMVPPTGSDADNSVRDLLKQIDSSIVVTIEPFKFPHYGATRPEDLQPGRYRLVRDDA